MDIRKCTACKHQYSGNEAKLITKEDDWTDECCPNCYNPEYTKIL